MPGKTRRFHLKVRAATAMKMSIPTNPLTLAIVFLRKLLLCIVARQCNIMNNCFSGSKDRTYLMHATDLIPMQERIEARKHFAFLNKLLPFM